MPKFELGNGQLFYEQAGCGTPIMFIHPPGMGRKVFWFQRFLSEKYKVIFPDLSGHGDSTAVSDQISIRHYAEEVRNLIDYMDIDKIVLCAYSSGGIIAQEFALQYPDRTAALILCGGFAEVESPVLKYEHLLGMYFLKHAPELVAKAIASAHTSERKYRDELIRHMMKADRHTWFQLYNESLHYSCHSRLKNLTMPLLLVYGVRDFVNQHLRSYEKEVEGFKAVMIEKVAHQVPVKKWREFNKAVTEFLDSELAAKSAIKTH